MFFEDRTDAGVRLAEVFKLSGENYDNYQVIGLARGGMAIAYELAHSLSLPLSALCVDDLEEKEGERLVVTSLGTLHRHVKTADERALMVAAEPIPNEVSKRLSERVVKTMAKQAIYDKVHKLDVSDKVIVCDDGFVSGETAFSAIEALRFKGAKKVTLAVPVVPSWLPEKVTGYELVTWRVSSLERPTSGMFYFSFDQVKDEDVVSLLNRLKYKS